MRTPASLATRSQQISIPAELKWLKELESKEQADFLAGLLSRLLAALKSKDWIAVADMVGGWLEVAKEDGLPIPQPKPLIRIQSKMAA